MSLTISNIDRSAMANKSVIFCDIAFDSSYAFGGEAITPASMGLVGISHLMVDPVKGYSFEWDKTNSKIKVFQQAPPIVYEEIQTIASNQITLDYPAAAILNMASASATQLLTEPSATLEADEVQLAAAMAWGERPTFTFHASTSGAIKVTYITQAWKEVWDNRVASEAGTAATHVVTLDNAAVFVESCVAAGTTGTNRPIWVRGGDEADTLECEIDFTDSGDTTLTFNSADAILTTTTTYIKMPSSGFIANRFIEDEDLAMSTGTGASAYPILFNSLCGQIPDYTAGGERDSHSLMMPEGDAVDTSLESAIDWHLNKTLAGTQIRIEDTSSDAVSLTYVYGFPAEIPGLVPIEVRNGEDLSSVLTGVKTMAIGY
jgi:hypothetical protein